MMKILATTLLVTALSACVTPVKPWERGALSERIMAWEVDPLAAALDDHIYFSKEASSGGSGAAGGGCGCN